MRYTVSLSHPMMKETDSFLGSETIKWMSRNMLSHDLEDLQTFYPTQRVQHLFIEPSRAIE